MRGQSLTFWMTKLSHVRSSSLLVGTNDGFADCVIDNSDDTFYSSDPLVMFGQGDFELDGREFDIQSRDHLEFILNKILACPCDVQSSINPDDSRGSSQCKGSSEFHGDARGGVVVQQLQVDCLA